MNGVFDFKNFRPLAEFCREGQLPVGEVTARRLANSGQLPAMKVRGVWYSSDELLRAWLYKGLNKAARRVLA
jgi:hypothetical protein